MPSAHTPDDPSHVQHRVSANANARPQHKQKTLDATTDVPNGADALADSRKSPTTERENRPPAKRARKAINCEPCRNSKLKCDRGRPCSSCVLRGTALHCYQGAADDPQEDHRGTKIDPHHEIARIRHSLATLEAYVIRGGAAATSSTQQGPSPASNRRDLSVAPTFKSELEGDDVLEKSAPGMLAQKGQGGLYAGPTSMVTHFLSVKSASNEGRDGEGNLNRPPFDPADDSVNTDQEQPRLQYDDDLLTLLPPLHIIDGLVDYYFEYCNWVYRHVHPPSFQSAWTRFKNGYSADRLVLATLCVIMGVAIRYLPERHALLTSLPHTHEELGERYYEICRDALARYRADCRTLSLELIECLLIRTHYLTLSKDKSEEIYALRGELVSIGTAMGLHRDPGKWHMPRDVAERRRWAWWHIILLESWQCFLFGRPPSVSCHHWDTSLPSNVDHDSDPADRRSLEPNLHLFRLARVLCDIVDDAVSIRPVSYDRVAERDRQLQAWMEALPKELDLDEFRVARALASPIPSTTRLGVQSIIIRCSYYHIRFTLHRPYAAEAHDLGSLHDRQGSPGKSFAGGSNSPMDERMAQSLDTAVNAADKLIQLSAQAQPDRFANSALTTPGHIHWLPFHCFSAAMFFSFQLIANPDQPGANLFRANIRRVLELLSISRGVLLADKAAAILNALAPLYEPPPLGETETERETKKKTVLAVVRGLAFPYHDSPVHARPSGDSPSTYGRHHLDSPSHMNMPPHGMVSPVTPHVNGSPTHNAPLSQQQHLDSVTSPVNHRPNHIGGYSHESIPTQQNLHHGMPPMPQSHQTSPPPPTMHHHHPAPVAPHHPAPAMNGNGTSYSGHMQPPTRHPYSTNVPGQHPEYSDVIPYPQPSDEMTMQLWGASVGFGQGEWARFIDSMQRPAENSRI